MRKSIIMYLALETPLLKSYITFCHLHFVEDVEIVSSLGGKKRTWGSFKI